jgi:Skp family chaperone for outer membrane proteins
MTRTRMAWIGLIALAITLIGVVGAGAQGLAAARPTKVAVVDVLKVFNSLQEKANVEADIRQRGERLRNEEEARRKELNDLQNDLQMLAPDTQAYTQKTEQIKSKLIELRVWSTINSDNLQAESSIQLANLYRKMLDTIGRVAKENQYDMVLYKEQQADFQNAKAETINQLIQIRKLLWSSDDLDLTDQVVTRMNNEYKNMVR